MEKISLLVHLLIFTILKENSKVTVNGFNSSRESPDLDFVRFQVENESLNSLDVKLSFLNTENKSILLKLEVNRNLISPYLRIAQINEDGAREFLQFPNLLRDQFYFYQDRNLRTSLKRLGKNKFEGILFFNEETWVIKPLYEKYPSSRQNDLHGLTRISSLELEVHYSIFKQKIFKVNNTSERLSSTSGDHLMMHTTASRLTLEIGLFFDEAAYQVFSSFFQHDREKLKDLLFAYMNGLQGVYHHYSLEVQIDIVIVYLEIMQKQPKELPTYDGERDNLLDSFCSYQRSLNPGNDSDVHHWDIGIYLTGLDIFSYENGLKSRGTMGLANVRSVCIAEYSCVITEFGVRNLFGKPYPSAGFLSIYVLAHEIGHSLGMSHDSFNNHCPRDGYIMSPSRGTEGETTWSPCSARVIRGLHTWAHCLKDNSATLDTNSNLIKYSGYPGRFWTAKKQCELLLRDNDAFEAPLNNVRGICRNLQCRTPHEVGFFFAGPALEGTECGNDLWCEDGYCLPKKPLLKPDLIMAGGWSDWEIGNCQFSCLLNSSGIQIRRRVCNNPEPINTSAGCNGLSYDIVLCSGNNDKFCVQKPHLETNIEYASRKCVEFSKFLPDVNKTGVGLQAYHENSRLWVACAIFCRKKDSLEYYSPRFELNQLGINGYFPDGTLCHQKDNIKFYCFQHHCLPEGFQFTKNNLWEIINDEDIPIPQNAFPFKLEITKNKILEEYLSLDRFGKPIRTQIFKKDISDLMASQKWIEDCNDYRDLPNTN